MQDKVFVREITPRAQDYSQWYVDVATRAELMDYSPVKGCMVFRPYGFGIWERIQGALDPKFKATGHANAYFPLFIPESFLKKEAEHFAGFVPEVAWVTHGGGEELAERLAIRPTSEAMICHMYARWIQSWRDLPMLLNQWCNVVRWEKATRPFLRTTEFLWQEGHTCHATEEEAERETLQMLDIYRETFEEDLALAVVPGRKTEAEKFAGALRTYTVEALMSDGKALQAGTSHNLGQFFARVFDILYLDRDGQQKHVWQTSWGVSTRLIGALIMVHGDDRGLVLPPRVAPLQAVIVPIAPQRQRQEVLEAVRQLHADLAGRFRVKLDDREEHSPGWKFNEWEMRGVPVRIELGPRDLAAGRVVMVRRDDGAREEVALAEVARRLAELLDEVQAALRRKAWTFTEQHTRIVGDSSSFRSTLEECRGLLVAGWCGDAGCEARVKADTGATIRCLPLAGAKTPVAEACREAAGAPCVHCGRRGGQVVVFGRAY
ncbi:MAG TPA: proline--tRNA ligase [Clostridiales bacterium]|nr:proline--tRNA ligase [Clostridiales bacterium]